MKIIDSFIGMLPSFLVDWNRKARNLYARGYNDMRAKLNTTYCGTNVGYNPVLVMTAYNKLRASFNGSEKDRRSYFEGIRDAVTVYERDHGAP
jgi:hypothetical protein